MPQKSKTRKHADIISSLTFDDAGNLTGFENPESVTLPGLEVTGQSIFNGNVGVVGNTVFTGSTIDIKQGGVYLGSDSDSFNKTAIFYGTDSDDVWTRNKLKYQLAFMKKRKSHFNLSFSLFSNDRENGRQITNHIPK